MPQCDKKMYEWVNRLHFQFLRLQLVDLNTKTFCSKFSSTEKYSEDSQKTNGTKDCLSKLETFIATLISFIEDKNPKFVSFLDIHHLGILFINRALSIYQWKKIEFGCNEFLSWILFFLTLYRMKSGIERCELTVSTGKKNSHLVCVNSLRPIKNLNVWRWCGKRVGCIPAEIVDKRILGCFAID